MCMIMIGDNPLLFLEEINENKKSSNFNFFKKIHIHFTATFVVVLFSPNFCFLNGIIIIFKWSLFLSLWNDPVRIKVKSTFFVINISIFFIPSQYTQGRERGIGLHTLRYARGLSICDTSYRLILAF